MKIEVRSKLEEIRREFIDCTHGDISTLCWQERDPITIEGKKYYPAVWSQNFLDGEALFVAQLTRWYFFKLFGATDCIGFTLKPGGKPELVDEVWLMNEVGHP